MRKGRKEPFRTSLPLISFGQTLGEMKLLGGNIWKRVRSLSKAAMS